MPNEQSSSFPSNSQKSVREHIARSSGGATDFQRSPQNYNPQAKASKISSTKKSRMEHIERSKGNYDLSSVNKQDRKSRIMSHVNITRP
ncbi:MAG: hypothetical protein ACFCAD_06410 [Pleurocapsa sp.]